MHEFRCSGQGELRGPMQRGKLERWRAHRRGVRSIRTTRHDPGVEERTAARNQKTARKSRATEEQGRAAELSRRARLGEEISR